MAKGNKNENAAGNSAAAKENAELLLGQMMFAIGSGAAGVHISRSAVARMRERYAGPTYKFVSKPGWEKIWASQSIYTLRWFTAVGRSAAELVTEHGDHSIDDARFECARKKVESTYRSKPKPNDQLKVLGDICPDPDIEP